MHDADHRHVGAIVLDRLVEGDRRLGIERPGRLVEEQQARLLQQDAGDDQLLLLAAGQQLVPAFAGAHFLAEMLDELAQSRPVQRGRGARVGVVVRTVRQAHQLLERDARQLDVLRGVERS